MIKGGMKGLIFNIKTQAFLMTKSWVKFTSVIWGHIHKTHKTVAQHTTETTISQKGWGVGAKSVEKKLTCALWFPTNWYIEAFSRRNM